MVLQSIDEIEQDVLNIIKKYTNKDVSSVLIKFIEFDKYKNKKKELFDRAWPCVKEADEYHHKMNKSNYDFYPELLALRIKFSKILEEHNQSITLAIQDRIPTISSKRGRRRYKRDHSYLYNNLFKNRILTNNRKSTNYKREKIQNEFISAICSKCNKLKNKDKMCWYSSFNIGQWECFNC